MTPPGQSDASRSSHYTSALGALLLIAVATALRIVELGTKSLWLDEAASSMLARADWHTFSSALVHRQANMALYYLLLRGWVHVPFAFGASEAVLRLPSVIFGGAAIAAAFKLMQHIASVRAAWIAAFLMVINLFHIQYSQEARGYALVTVLALLSCYFFVHMLSGETRRAPRMVYIVVTALMIYAQVFGGWIVLAQIVATFIVRADRRKAMAVDAGIVFLLASPLALSLLFASDRSQLSWMNPAGAAGVYAVMLDFAGGTGALLLMLFVVLILFSLGSRWRNPQPAGGVQAPVYIFLWTWLVLPILSVWIISLYRPALQSRYLIVCLPAFLFLAGDGLAHIRSRIIFVAALAAVTGLSLVGLNSYYRARADQTHSDNWRDATAYCLSEARPGDAALFTYSAEEIAFRAYEQRKVQAHAEIPVVPQKTELELLTTAGTWTSSAQAVDAATRYRRLWVITALQPSAASEQAQAALRVHSREKSQREFGFVKVQLFVAPGSEYKPDL